MATLGLIEINNRGTGLPSAEGARRSLSTFVHSRNYIRRFVYRINISKVKLYFNR
jgi:hypothetical protein